MSGSTKINVIRYSRINSCLAAFFGCRSSEVNKQDGYWEWRDAEGGFKRTRCRTAIKHIRKRGAWGWVENKGTIHVFVRKSATLREIIGLVAHELGHKQRPYHRTSIEEQKACKYAEVAKAAFDLAMALKGEKK